MSCPFCKVAGGRETKTNALSDVVLRDELTTAFVSPKWWEASPGHVIVVPNEHVRDVYEVPDGLLGAVYGTAPEERLPLAERLRAALEADL